MATPRPKTKTKRSTSKPSARFVRKKQGVTKKQAFALVAALAVIGVIAVVASRAATAPNKVYINTELQPRYVDPANPNGGSYGNKIYRIASDNSSESSKYWNGPSQLELSRDKLKLLGIWYGNAALNTYRAKDMTALSNTSCPDSDRYCYSGYKELVWLAGGDRAAYIRGGSASVSGFSIGTMNSSGGDNITIVPETKVGWLDCLVLDRSGTRLMYREIGAGSPRIVTMKADGSDRKVIKVVNAVSSTGMNCPTWSNDGKKISYSVQPGSFVGEKVELHIMDANGANDKVVTIVKPYRSAPLDQNRNDAYLSLRSANSGRAWSPGNSSVLFTKAENGVQNLYYVNVNTKKITAVTSNKSSATQILDFGWSSDGRIIYSYGAASDVATLPLGKTVKSVKSDITDHKLLFQASPGETIRSIVY